MKIILSVFLLTLLCAFTMQSDKNKMNNPFFQEWKTPFGTPPFDRIKDEHFMPAYVEGMKQQMAEVEKIISNKEKATFKNTIEAFEKSGKLFTKVNNVFNALNGANTNETLQEIAQKTAPMISKHFDGIYLNEKFFDRIKSIYQKKEKLELTVEQKVVVENYYKDFVRGGANLNKAEKEKFKKINEELSLLGVKFAENILKESNAIGLVINNKDDLAGLPEGVVQGAAETAKGKGLEGKWAFTLQRPSWTPFLQYSPKRELREKLFKAYLTRGNNNNELDTKNILTKMASLRVEKANLLGYKTYADFRLEINMAKNPENVYKFLNDLWKPALSKAGEEAADMQKMIDTEGGKFKLQPWDWWYYSEKVRSEKFSLDGEMLRPYFKLENVIAGAFGVASKLYGFQFVELKNISVYHPDVKVFEVKEADDKHVGILYIDYFPRDSKRSGAWMSEFTSQSNIDGKFISPIIYNVGNFTKPTKDKPALLSFDDVNTLFHEFGHALHYLIATSIYPSGKRVPVDFVEMPSQVMENWASDPVVLKMYAKHYITGEAMPDELIHKIVTAGHFNQGFETTEYLAASLLDLDWHTISDTNKRDALTFEHESLEKHGLIPEIESRYQSTNFQHIFADDGYAAGYYGYVWAAVLDADAFAAFKEKNDVFDKATAKAFRNLLQKAGSDDPMVLYEQFRGRKPGTDALLEKRGLK
ncbi:MAG: peptidase M3 [Ignavibacteria bacterium CG_4_8_14_3_um_filter_37_9]|nr:M3 family metallopeptidase [Ignavibacteria bacterium]OIO23804.1 MAG: peptidase M3 [Ignavibacteria bacterium CG1_02_37_35]PIS44164.1 MAG: peptidase M3 [Ignavibacteria bacterium CG08_land_8_20_14_0_20_37_9]PIW98135.1 MAG: peptidase M3 [Ignavibacteria bacterium CG_4_8_14_3_um_filter_37_9]PIX94208.1 MAG: peptidase M3 [Ignavibacteria bacterium CG_4_10_14_3_um_filter_37_18]PJC58027.1 MAG: peptidase M3 [Ignavibacteria bacterium CG_4_9_14_0_2_um_filter_37_13]